jgi:hypothetical protein
MVAAELHLVRPVLGAPVVGLDLLVASTRQLRSTISPRSARELWSIYTTALTAAPIAVP